MKWVDVEMSHQCHPVDFGAGVDVGVVLSGNGDGWELEIVPGGGVEWGRERLGRMFACGDRLLMRRHRFAAGGARRVRVTNLASSPVFSANGQIDSVLGVAGDVRACESGSLVNVEVREDSMLGAMRRIVDGVKARRVSGG